MNRRRTYSIAFILALFSALPSYAEEWLYTVRPGDEIWNIASKYCGSAKFSARIIEFNQISNERGIRPGQRLRIPIEWLVRQPSSAEIINMRGTAMLHRPAIEPATVGQQIDMGNRLITEDGNVLVGFADGSTLNVGPESELLFNVLTAYGDTGMVDTNLRFYRGRGTSKIIRRNDASRFRISTPVGTAAVRGTEFRVSISENATLTETLEGSVGFIQSSEIAIPQGFGAAASNSGVVTEALLPAPQWVSATGVYSSGTPLAWRSVNGASSYRVALYSSSNLDAPVQEQVTQTTSHIFSDVAPGNYSVTVRGVSGTDLEGYDATLIMVFGSPPPVGRSSGAFNQNDLVVRWDSTGRGAPYTVQVARDAGFVEEVLLDDAAKSEFELELLPGQYFWRVRDSSSVYSEPQSVTVRPYPPISVSVAHEKLQLELSWSPVDPVDSYRVRIARDASYAKVVFNESVNQSEMSVAVPGYGSYFAEIVTITNGVESEAKTIEFRVERELSRWLLALFAIPLLF